MGRASNPRRFYAEDGQGARCRHLVIGVQLHLVAMPGRRADGNGNVGATRPACVCRSRLTSYSVGAMHSAPLIVAGAHYIGSDSCLPNNDFEEFGVRGRCSLWPCLLPARAAQCAGQMSEIRCSGHVGNRIDVVLELGRCSQIHQSLPSISNVDALVQGQHEAPALAATQFLLLHTCECPRWAKAGDTKARSPCHASAPALRTRSDAAAAGACSAWASGRAKYNGSR